MKVLVIGSCVLDVSVEIDALPGTAEDVNTKDLQLNLGGMAYNVFNLQRLFKSGAVLGCPIGEGRLADTVGAMLSKKGCRAIGKIPGMDNGMCICLVDAQGERSFISHHGAEYRFRREHFQDIDFSDISWIYADGLEIEDRDGWDIIEFLEEKGRPLFFAPGPRVNMLGKEKLERLFALHPILHINEREAGLISGNSKVFESISEISAMTGNSVIITLGERGSLIKEPGREPILIETRPRKMLDATGAGDCHAGTVLAMLNSGLSLERAVRCANIVSGYAVEQKGADLSEENFAAALEEIRSAGLI